ncbi:MAG: ATP-dependent helicase, partial [Patescibacteria group bacterium]
ANESIAQNADQFEKALRTGNDSGAKPRLGSYASASQEAASIARDIMRRLRQGADPREMAVLFRAAYQSQALEFELMKNGIAYEYRGGMRFFERAHIKDVIALQRVVENPKDAAALLRIVGMQACIGPAMAQKVIELVQGATPEMWMSEEVEARLPARARSGWAMARGMLRSALDHASMAEQIRALLGTSYVDYLEHSYTNAADRLMDIEQLATFAETYVDRAKFLEDVSLTDEFGATMDQGARKFEPRPVLSTIHQAKGLEWDTVYVISLADGAFPSRRAMDSEEDIEEERRLFYVAVTRARKHLHLSYAMTGMGEQAFGAMPSMFIQELSFGLLDREERVIAPSSFSRYSEGHQGDFVPDEPVVVLDEGDATQLEGAPLGRPRRSSGYLGNY